MGTQAVQTLIGIIALSVSELLTLDKNKDGNLTGGEIFGAILVIAGQAQGLTFIWSDIWPEITRLHNNLEVKNDEHDKLIQYIGNLDFMPASEQDALEEAIKKTIIALFYMGDAIKAWMDVGVADEPNVVLLPGGARIVKKNLVA